MKARGFQRQQDLAAASGVRQSSVSDLIAGVTTRDKVRASTLVRLAEALGTTWEYLWAGSASIDAQQEAQLVAVWRGLDEPGRAAVLHYARGVHAAQQAAAAAHSAVAEAEARKEEERTLAARTISNGAARSKPKHAGKRRP